MTKLSEYRANYYQAHREEMNARSRAYYQKNKRKQRKCIAKWREAHPDKVKAYNRRSQAKIHLAARQWKALMANLAGVKDALLAGTIVLSLVKENEKKGKV